MLRGYQLEAVEAIWSYWQKGKRNPAILQLSTGAGKSWVIAELVRRLNSPVLVLQPSKEILEQNYEKLLLAGVPQEDISICSASVNSWKIGKITLATIGTIYKHADHCERFVVCIVDECDTVTCDNAKTMHMKFFNRLPNLFIVGLTATPYRNQSFRDAASGDPALYCRPLTRIFTCDGKDTAHGVWFWTGGIIYKCEIPFLQSQGYLAPTRYFEAETNWSFLKNYPGRTDFKMEEAAQWTEFDENLSRFHQAVSWCLKNNQKTVVFSPMVRTNFQLAEVIQEAGGSVECMDSENDTKTSREEKMERFRNGEFQFLVNVGMMGRGVDVPSIDAVIMARPTKSLALYTQFIGRALRPDPDNPNKVANILDLAGNVARFGRVEDISLGKEKRPNSYYPIDIIKVKLGEKYYKWEKVS